MSRPAATAKGARRLRSASAALALIATGLVIAAGWTPGSSAPVAVDYALSDDDAILDSEGQAGRASLEDVRARLTRFAHTGDARQLRYAEAELEAWLAIDAPVPEALLLHARIRQSKHEFDEAATILRRVLDELPQSAEAWLLYADAERRAGRPDAARRGCLKLALTGEAVLARFCALPVALAAGDADSAYRLSRDSAESLASLDPAARRWALELSAEAAAATGRIDEATSDYEAAMSDGNSTLASRLGAAHWLLEADRPARVLELLAGDAKLPAAQVRIAAALRRLDRPLDADLRASLDRAFGDTAVADADPLGFRDRALFELWVREDPNAALRFALANWETQKSFEDLELVESAAEAAGNHLVLRDLRRWQQAMKRGDRS